MGRKKNYIPAKAFCHIRDIELANSLKYTEKK
jgi:hypothetical protein